MDNVVDTLKIEIVGDSSDGVKSVDDFISKLESIKSVTNSVNKNLKSITSGLEGLDSEFKKVGSNNFVSKLGGIQTKVGKIGSKISAQISKIVPKNDFSGSQKIESTTTPRIDQTPQNAPKAPDFSGQTEQSSKSVERLNTRLTETVRKTESVTKTANNSRSVWKSVGSIASKSFSIIGSGAKRAFGMVKSGSKVLGSALLSPLKKLGSILGNVGTKLKGFARSIGRIALYRAIRSLIKGITNAFKEGVGNVYQYSKALNGTFAKSMDKISTNALYIKNSLGAMAVPLINAISPVIEVLTDKFVSLLNTINQVIAKLSGAKTWTKALRYPKQYAEAADGASDKIKELKKSILGIDEISALTDNSDNGSSKSGSDLNYSKMFEEVSLDSGKFKFLNSFEGIGGKIAEKINYGLKKINWGKIEKTSEGIAVKIGGFINGFVDKLDASLLGKTLGKTINTAFRTANTLVKTIKWGQIGSKLATTLNSMFKTTNMKLVGETLANTINAPIHFAEQFAYTFDWSQFGTRLSTGLYSFVSKLNLDNVANALSTGLKGVAKTSQKLFSSPAWSLLGSKLRSSLITFFNGNPLSSVANTVRSAIKAMFNVAINLFAIKNGKDVATSLGKDFAKMVNDFFKDSEWWSKAGKTLSSITKGICRFLKRAIEDIDTEKIYNAIVTLVKSIDWIGIASEIASLILTAAFKAVTLVFPSLGKIFDDKKIGSYIKKVISSENISDALTPTYKKIVKDAKDRSKNNSKNSKSNTQQQQNALKNIAKSLGVDTSKLVFKANGGFVNTGQAFIARERGPELVGTIGNRTAVVNNEQIVASVAQGVADANDAQNALLREQNSLLRQILAKENGDGVGIRTSEIISAFQRKNRRDGRTVVPVGI